MRKQVLVMILVLGTSAWAQPRIKTWEGLNAQTLSFYKQGDYRHALSTARQALQMAQKAGADSVAAQSMNNLGLIYKALGQYDQAESIYLFALALGQEAGGPQAPSVALTLNNLAALYDVEGKVGQAQSLYQQALALKEKALGPDHLSVALILNNLAELHCKQGHWAQAESLYRQVLKIRERQLGPHHPLVALTLEHLAALYRQTGRQTQADQLMQQAAAIRAATGFHHNQQPETRNQ